MNFSKENHQLNHQDEKGAKKSQKHEVNLQKNSTLYFQIGLIICLLATYYFMDMKFLSSDKTLVLSSDKNEIADVFTLDEYKLYEEPSKKKITKKDMKKVVIKNKIKEIPDDVSLMEPKLDIITPDQDKSNVAMNPDDFNIVDPPTDDPIIFKLIEIAPIFPGCEKFSTNEQRKSCMSKKISKLVQRKFNKGIAQDLGLSGKQHFHVQFKIDKTGHVTDIISNAKFKQLDEEAKRIIGKLPKMKPGRQQDKNVSVLYNLPIVFEVF